MTSVVAPPRKNKRSPEKKQVDQQKSIPLTDKDDEVTVSAELQTEDKTFKPSVPAAMEDTITTSVEQTRIEPTQLKPQSETSASEPITAQPSNTDGQSKAIKPDITAEPVAKPAAEEPVLIRKVIEQSAPGVEKTTPVASRRKPKTSAVDTEPTQTKLEPKVVQTIITQVSASTGTATEEETKNIESITPGSVSEPFTTEQAETVVLKETKLTPTRRRSKEGPDSQKPTEITETTVSEKAKLSPTKKKSKGLKVPPELAIEDVTPSRRESNEGPQGQKPTEIVEPVLEKVGQSKGLKILSESTTAEPTKSREEPDSQRPAPEMVTTSPQTTVVEKDTLSPTQKESKGVKLSSEIATTKLTKTKEEPDSQKSSSAAELVTVTTEISVVEKRPLTKRKSKGLKLSSELATEDVTETIKEPDRQKSLEQTEAAVLEETKIVPSRRKSKEGQQGHTPTEMTELVLEKGDISPTKRKSKGLKPFSELGSTKLTKTQEEPYSQKPSSTPGGATGPTEITVVQKGKLSPTKRQSKGLKLSPEAVTTELAQTKEKPESQKPPLSSRVQTEMVVDEETKIATIILDVLAPLTTEQAETVVLKETKLTPTRRKTKEDPDSQKPTEITGATVLEKGDLTPTKRKSKGLKLSPESATTELTPTKEEPDSQRHSLSSRVQTGPVAVEETKKIATIILDVSEPLTTEQTETTVLKETKLMPTRRKTKNGDSSTTSQTVRSPDVEPEQNKKVSDIQKSSNPDAVTGPTQNIVAEKEMGELSPTKRQSKALKLSPEHAPKGVTKTMKEPDIQKLTQTTVEPETQKPSVSSKVQTTMTVDETKNIATIILDVSEPFTMEKNETVVLKDTKVMRKSNEDSDSQKPTEIKGTTVLEKGKLSPTKRQSKGLKISPELATKDVTETIKESERPKSLEQTKVAVVQETKTVLTRKKSKESPDGQKPTEITTTTTVLEKGDFSPKLATTDLTGTKEESQKPSSTPGITTVPTESTGVDKGKLSPTKRQSKGLKVAPELATTELTQTKDEPDSQNLSLSSRVQTETVVEETKNIATIILDVSEPFTTKQIKTDVLKETKVMPTRRKSKEDPDSQKPTEMTEATDLEKAKLTPTKRQSKGLKLSPEITSTELTQTEEEAENQKPSLSSIVQTETGVVEETKNIATIILDISESLTSDPEALPTGKESMSLEVTTVPESVSSLERTTGVESRETKQGPENDPAVPEFVQRPAENAIVQQTKFLPPKRKSKSTELPLKHADTDEPQTRKGPEGQKSSLSSNDQSVVIEESKLVPTRRKSKSGDISTTSETVAYVRSLDVEADQKTKEPESQKPSTPEVVTTTTEITVVEKSVLSPTKRKSKGLKPSPEPATAEPAKSREEPDSQKPSSAPEVVTTTSEATAVQQGTLSPTKRESNGHKPTTKLMMTKEEPASQKPPSTQEMITTTTETTTVEKDTFLPTERKSKGLKLFPESATAELAKGREEPDSQKPSANQELVKTTSEATVVEQGTLSPTERESRVQKPSSDFTTTKLMMTNEEPASQKPSSAPEVATTTSEATVVEQGILSPTKRKSKGLKPSSKSATAQLAKDMEEPDSQKPSANQELVKESSEITVVEKGQPSPSKTESKGLKPSSEIATTKLTKTKEQPDTEKPSLTQEIVTTTTEISVVEKSVLSPTKRKSKGLKLSPEPATAEPAKSSEERDRQQPKGEEFSTPPETASVDKTKTEQEKVKCSSTPEFAHAKPLEPKDTTGQTITQSIEKVKSCEVPQRQPPLSTKPTDTPNLADYIKDLWKNTDETEKRYIVLDLPDTGVTQTGEMKPHQPETETVVDSDSTQPTSTVFAVAPTHKAEAESSGISSTEQDKPLESVSQMKLPETTKERPKEYTEQPQSKDITSTDIQQEKAAVKLTRVEVQESISKYQDSVAEGGSKQPTSAVFTAVQPSEADTTVLQMSSSKQDTGTPSQKLEVLRTTQERPTEFKEYDTPVKHGEVLTHDVNGEPKSLDEKSVKKIHLGPEVCVLEIDIQTRPEEENASVSSAKGIDVDIQTSIQREGVPQNKDRSSAEFKPEKGAIKMTTIEVRESSTDDQDNMALKDSAQPPTASKALPVDEVGTECIEICFSEQDLVKPNQTETQKGLLKSLGDDKNTSVTKAKEPRVDVRLTSIQSDRVPEYKGIPTVDVRPEQTAVEQIKVQESSTKGQDKVPQRDLAQPTSPVSETLQPHVTEFIEINLYEQDILKPSQTETKTELLKSTHGTPPEVKEHGLRDEHPKVPTRGMQGVPKHMDEKSVKMEKILKPATQATVKEHDNISVETAKATTVDVDQTSIPSEKVPGNKDLTSAAVQPEKDKVKMAMVEVKTKELDHKEQHPKVLMDGATKSMDQTSVTTEKIIKETDEGALQKNIPVVQVEEENVSVMLTKKPRKVKGQTSTQGEKVPEIKDQTSAGVQPKKAAVETREEVQEIRTERQENVTEGDSTSLPTSAILAAGQPQDPGREFVTISLSEQDQLKPSQTGTQPELTKTTQDRPKEVKEQVVHGIPKSLEQKSVEMVEIQQTLHEYKTVTIEKEPRMESSIQFETAKQSQDVAAPDVQPKSTVKMTRVEVQERFAESLSEPSVVPKTQTEKTALDAIEMEEEQKRGKKSTIQEKETMVKVEIRNVPLPVATTTTTAVMPQSADSPQVRHGVTY